MRGSSQSEPKDAKVVTLTRLRLRAARICRTLASIFGRLASTARNSSWPFCVISTWRVPRTKSAAPSSSSKPLICRLIADCVTNSSSAASLKLERRATASNARRLLSDKGRRVTLLISVIHIKSASISAVGFIGFLQCERR